jgi:hypothetical protein
MTLRTRHHTLTRAATAAPLTDLPLKLKAEPGAIGEAGGADVAHDPPVLVVDKHRIADCDVSVSH